jgi:ABC-type nitrate/sulfonate/bicarbonate transport system ATPase subunit
MILSSARPRAALLRAVDLHKEFPHGARRVAALDGISLHVDEGEVVCIVGPSGCGKTTLLRILGGLEAPTSGAVSLLGEPVTRPTPSLGFVFQEPRLLPWLSVADNVGFALRTGTRAERQVRIDEQLARVGLLHVAAAHPHQLSGGMAQRAAIARALVNHPRILLLDEPLSALDPITRADLQAELVRLLPDIGCTTVLVTHDIEEAVFLADRVLVLSPSPAQIRAEVAVSLLHPRDRLSPAFAEIRQGLALAIGAIRPLSSL